MHYSRPADQRGKANFGWLDSSHSFSFGNYYDPQHMGFGVLRVINDDRIAPAAGFDTHGHRDMEIISYPIRGALAHKDSLGNGSTITAGEVQRMSAGTGVQHSEFNASQTDEARFLQIWILPKARDLAPSYEQKLFPMEERTNRLTRIISETGLEGALRINQDVQIFAGLLDKQQSLTYTPSKERKIWLQVATGSISVDDKVLVEGDGLGLQTGKDIVIQGIEHADFLVFDLPN